MLASDLGYGAAVDLPASNIRYRLLPRTELRIRLPDHFYSSTAAAPSGFGDSAVGVKQQLGPLGGFDVSIIAFLSILTGANQLLSPWL